MIEKEVKTEHPYIVKINGICGGRPIIKGTRITVELIANLFRRGCSPEEIAATYPHLKPAAIYDALSYYFDHQEEIDKEIQEKSLEDLKQEYGFELGGRGLGDSSSLRFSGPHLGEQLPSLKLGNKPKCVFDF